MLMSGNLIFTADCTRYVVFLVYYIENAITNNSHLQGILTIHRVYLFSDDEAVHVRASVWYVQLSPGHDRRGHENH